MIGCIGHDGDCCKTREQDLKDAARYRWLRASDFDVFGSPHAVDLAGEELDQAIDAAMLGANVELTGAGTASALDAKLGAGG